MRWGHLLRLGAISDQHPEFIETTHVIMREQDLFNAAQERKRDAEMKRRR